MRVYLRGQIYWCEFIVDKIKHPDPAGTGKDVAAYLHGDALQAARSKVKTALERCERAQRAFTDDDSAGMHEAYRRVFGDYYPA